MTMESIDPYHVDLNLHHLLLALRSSRLGLSEDRVRALVVLGEFSEADSKESEEAHSQIDHDQHLVG